ncbi:MAG: peroxiredoxin-like family protein [Verrucomicrobiota bacterium]
MKKTYFAAAFIALFSLDISAETAVLEDELGVVRERLKGYASPEDLKVVEDGMQEVVDSELAEAAIRKGNTVPDFTLKEATGEEVTLSELYEEGPVVLTWYRGGWCPYCNIQLKAYQQILPEIEAAGAKLVAVTPELPDHSLSTAERHELKFIVLSDVGNVVAKDFGLVYGMSDELVRIYKDFEIDLAVSNGPEAKSNELPLPATYIIGTDGKVAWHFIDPDYSKRAEPATIIEELKKL